MGALVELCRAGSRVLERTTFDTLIIDEAAQCVEPSCWIPILKATRLILAGDHLQLPPTVKSAKPGEGLDRADLKPRSETAVTQAEAPAVEEGAYGDEAGSEVSGDHGKESGHEEEAGDQDQDQEGAVPTPDGTSTPASVPSPPPAQRQPRRVRLRLSTSLTTTLFSRLLALHGDGIRRMLEVSYRFNNKICSFPSRRLYGGALVAAKAVKDRRLTDLEGVYDEEMEEQVIFIDSELELWRLWWLAKSGLLMGCVFGVVCTAAGAGMYERAPEGKQGSYGTESKANENEAQLCLEYVDELVSNILPGMP